jgi:hypothetical protein
MTHIVKYEITIMLLHTTIMDKWVGQEINNVCTEMYQYTNNYIQKYKIITEL